MKKIKIILKADQEKGCEVFISVFIRKKQFRRTDTEVFVSGHDIQMLTPQRLHFVPSTVGVGFLLFLNLINWVPRP